MARHADLKIGVVPVINLEWIQKIHRDKFHARLFDRSRNGYDPSPDARLYPLYLPAIHRNRRQLPARANGRYLQPVHSALDTNCGQIARRDPLQIPRGIDFAYLVSMLQGSFMSRANSIVIPGSKLDLAMQLILTPMILQLIERSHRAS